MLVDHIAAEAADVMYFLMTRCVAGGVGLADIEAHLEKRSFKVLIGSLSEIIWYSCLLGATCPEQYHWAGRLN